MAGLFPGICNGQNVDANGQPLASAVLTVYNGGTLQLASVYQDIDLQIPGSNPMTADITGRLPLFYVADSTYRVRLVDQTGILIYDYPQVASIGASSSGGGGTPVDPTTIFQTGDVLWQDVSGIRSGWVRNNGLTIGSAVSGASERANADCQNLFLWGWQQNWTVVGGAGASAAADWAANKQLTLPDYRGYVPGNLDDMGNTPAGRYTGVPFVSGNATTAASVVGEATHVLLLTESTPHTHALNDPGHAHYVTDPTHNHGVNDPTHSHGVSDPTHAHSQQGNTILSEASGHVPGLEASSNEANTGGTTGNSATGISISAASTGISIQSHATGLTVNTATTGITMASVGGGAAHNNTQLTVLGTSYRKL